MDFADLHKVRIEAKECQSQSFPWTSAQLNFERDSLLFVSSFTGRFVTGTIVAIAAAGLDVLAAWSEHTLFHLSISQDAMVVSSIVDSHTF